MRTHYIREWRKHRRLTQAQLADAMGLARTFVTMVEVGTRRYNQDFLEAAADVLHCDISDLIARPPGQKESIDSLLAGVDETNRARVEAAVRAMLSPVTEEDGE